MDGWMDVFFFSSHHKVTTITTTVIIQERARLQARGARVVRTSNGTAGSSSSSGSGDVWRVEGQLALSRSIGDVYYDAVLSRAPHVTARSLRADENPEAAHYRYLILASDGLWDVMSNAEAVAFLEERAREMRGALRRGGGGEGEGGDGGGMGGPGLDYHVLARALTWEVRGWKCGWVGGWCVHGGSELLLGPLISFQTRTPTNTKRQAYVRGSSDNIGVLIVDLKS